MTNNNFDFFVGTWTSKQRRIREWFTGSDKWEELDGETRCWSIFDGAGNLDELVFRSGGFSGLSVRLYNAERDEWSIYWANSTNPASLALPPVVGRFHEDGRGIFTSPDVYKGEPIEVEYLWSDITEDSCRWQQSCSADDGATWEVNWVGDFTRTGH
jgi:hypothetical protein